VVSTKVDLNASRVARVRDLDELAAILFPGNRAHQKLFLIVFVELKWADNQFLTVLEPIADKYGVSRRVLENVRAKMRRLGIIDHVSRFNKRYGYREGWVFSKRFERSLERLAQRVASLRADRNPGREHKDRDSIQYV